MGTSGRPPLPRRLALTRAVCAVLPPVVAQRVRAVLYPPSLGLSDDVHFEMRSQTGSTFQGRTSDMHAHPFAVHGYFDWRRWAVAAAACPPGGTIIEIGANVGTETVGFSDIAGPRGRVIAFEPVPLNVTELESALANARHANVEIRAAAVSDSVGVAHFEFPPDRRRTGIGHIVAEGAAGETTAVPTTTLDTLAAELDRVDIVFSDAEGAEGRILRGGREMLRTLRPTLVLECTRLLARHGDTLAGVHAFLTENGYVVQGMSRFGLTELVPTGVVAKNWVAVARGNEDTFAKISRAIRRCALLPPFLGVGRLSARA